MLVQLEKDKRILWLKNGWYITSFAKLLNKSKQLFIPIDFITFHGTFQGGFVGFKLHTNAASDVQPVRAVGWHVCLEAKQIAREKPVF